MKKLLIVMGIFFYLGAANAQTTFPSPGSQTCSTTTTTLPARTASDGVTLTSYLWTDRPCVDTDLLTVSVNDCTQALPKLLLQLMGFDVSMCHVMAGGNHAFYRKPTYCYANDLFPTPKPLAIQRNSTANIGNCEGGRSNIVADFTSVANRPKGLTFTLADVDNPYDSVQIKVYSGGNLVNYTYQLADASNSYVITSNTGTGPDASFNGSSWDNISPTNNWNRGAIYFTVDPTVYVDSVVMSTVIKSNRPDMNPNLQIGNFVWQEQISLPVLFGNVNATIQNDLLTVNWNTETENNSASFDIQASADGKNFTSIGKTDSKAVNGTSNATIQYSFTKTGSSALLSTALLAAIVLLIAVTHRLKNNKRWIGALSVIILLGTLAACSKNNDSAGTANPKNMFIRILQVDKDGKTTASKTVKAVQLP